MTEVRIHVLDNDHDPDGDPLSVLRFEAPAHGTVSIDGGLLTYRPAADFTGAELFELLITDGRGGLDHSIVKILVSRRNRPPTAVDDTFARTPGTMILDVRRNDVDLDQDTLEVVSVTSPAAGETRIVGQAIWFTTEDAITSDHVFRYGVSDGRGGYDGSLDPGETTFNRDEFLFADLGAGLLWFMVFDANNSLYLGGAFHHLNRANQSFDSNDEDLLYSRFTAHAGGEFLVSRRFGLLPGVIIMSQGPSFQVNAGTSFKFLLQPATKTQGGQSFQFGLWTRVSNKIDSGVLTDAAILSTRFDYDNFSLGFSYDLNVSQFKPATNGNGGFELALVYKICGPARRGIYCPEF
jgi:type IX secretion system PorP/SprF family membrane protein